MRNILVFRSFFFPLKKRKKEISPLIVSVGNISLGGSGKTPFVHLLTEALLKKSIKTAILSRGYRSFAEKEKEPCMIHYSQGLIASWQHIGDEPAMLARNLPDALVFVGKNRKRSLEIAEREKVKAVILDDGFQHRRVERDLDIVMINEKDLFKKQSLFPAGRLREPLSSLAHADYIVVTVQEERGNWDEIKKKAAHFSRALVLAAEQVFSHYSSLTHQKVALPKDEKIALFSAIAEGERFFSLCQKQNPSILLHFSHPDHFSFTQKELSTFSDEAKALGVHYLVCTEKDAIKLSKNDHYSLPIIYLKMNLKIIRGKEHFDKLVGKIDNINQCQ